MEAGELMANLELEQAKELEKAMLRAAANAGYSFRIVPGGDMTLERDPNLCAQSAKEEGK